MAAADYCDGGFTNQNFESLVGITSPGRVTFPGAGFLPMNAEVTMTAEPVASGAPNIRYRVFVQETNPEAQAIATENAFEIPVASVDSADQANNVTFRLSLPSETWFLAKPYAVLLVGCNIREPDDEPLAQGTPPSQFGAETIWVSSALRGYIWIAIAVLVIGGILVSFIYRYKGRLGSKWRSFLYLFTNFRGSVSLSLAQLFIFTATVAVTVAYFYGRTNQLTDLSTDVLYLLGISATGAVAGAWGDSTKNRLSWENWRFLDRHGAYQGDLTQIELGLDQLVTTRGEFDMYRFQALLFTLLVAPTFIIASAYALGDAEIPPGILAVLGLSQVTYLVGKFADTPTVSDFDVALGVLRKKLEEDGDRLTLRGLEELKQQFYSATGINWAADATDERTRLLVGETDAAGIAAAVALARENARFAASAAQGALTDKRPAAIVAADAAALAAGEAVATARAFEDAMYASAADAAAKQVADAVARAAAARAEVDAMLQG